jgi:hypothetical protein
MPSVYALPLMLETKFHTHTKQLAELWFCILYSRGKTIDSEQNGSNRTLDIKIFEVDEFNIF